MVNLIVKLTFISQQYKATGRGFVVRHIKFAENYRLYSRSHFVKGCGSVSVSLCVCVCVYLFCGSALSYTSGSIQETWEIFKFYVVIIFLSMDFCQ